MKEYNKLIRLSLKILAATFLIYFGFSFVYMSLDPSNWTSEYRASAATLWGIVLVLIVILD